MVCEEYGDNQAVEWNSYSLSPVGVPFSQQAQSLISKCKVKDV